MNMTWKDSIYRQREELARMLREPIEVIAQQITPLSRNRQQLEAMLLRNFSSIPYCTSLYVLDTNGVQICDNVGRTGLVPGHYGRDRSQRPYMKEAVPIWDFLLSDAYISQHKRRPSLTALQIIRTENQVLGYLGADFDLRDLPVTSEIYQEPENWRQVKGDPAIRNLLFQQTRVESPMDLNMEQALVILEEMLTQRGVFQMLIHFSSSQATIWMNNDPFRYRILDIEALTDPDICLVYPAQSYPTEASIPSEHISSILDTFKKLRMADENIYIRSASINLYNGMISLTFSCDGTHYMPYEEFLQKNTEFWFGAAA
jgi:hypothetical protein